MTFVSILITVVALNLYRASRDAYIVARRNSDEQHHTPAWAHNPELEGIANRARWVMTFFQALASLGIAYMILDLYYDVLNNMEKIGAQQQSS